MLDHLKDILRQLVGIVKDDPHVLDNYGFTAGVDGAGIGYFPAVYSFTSW